MPLVSRQVNGLLIMNTNILNFLYYKPGYADLIDCSRNNERELRNQLRSQDIEKYRNIMRYAARQYEQMPDSMKVRTHFIQRIKNNPKRIKRTTG